MPKKLPLLIDSKRPTEESIEAPPMSKSDAAKTYGELLSSAPKALKKQSLYVRFKKAMLEDARSEGDHDIISKITAIAKEKWNLVKSIDTSALENHENFSDEVQHLIVLKEQAEYADVMEKNNYESALADWCSEFQSVAVARLNCLCVDTTESNRKVLEDVVETIENLGNWSAAVSKQNMDAALCKAKEEIKGVRRSLQDKALVEKLRNASDDVLLQHAKDYHQALEQIENYKKEKVQLDTIRHQKEREDTKRAIETEKTATSLEGEIIRNMEKQMTYTGPGLRHSKKRITFNRCDVSEDVFAAAFNIPKGTKMATISACKISTKSLRYGARLRCDDVDVKFSRGNTITATSYYSLSRF